MNPFKRLTVTDCLSFLILVGLTLLFLNIVGSVSRLKRDGFSEIDINFQRGYACGYKRITFERQEVDCDLIYQIRVD